MDSYNSDNTTSASWLEAEQYFQDLQGPTKRQVSHAANLAISPDGKSIAFTGSVGQSLIGVPSLRICLLNLETKSVKVLTDGCRDDKEPQWSRDSQRIYYVSDRVLESSFQLYCLKPPEPAETETETQRLTFFDGNIESLSMSPAGTKILLGVASLGSHKAGSQGSGTIRTRDSRTGLAEWMPSVEPSLSVTGWRSIRVYDIIEEKAVQVNVSGLNVWEACWCGEDTLIVLVSDTPDESAWYSAWLERIDVESGKRSFVYQSLEQLQVGHVTSSPSGDRTAFVEALCSDRTLVSGRLKMIERTSREVTEIALDGMQDVVQVIWLNGTKLCLTGLRGLKTVIFEFDLETEKTETLYETSEGLGLKYPKVAVAAGKLAVVRESWMRYPEIALIKDSNAETIVSFDHPGAVQLRSKLGLAEPLQWTATDGVIIEGMLYLPRRTIKPYPLIVNAHGGPVYSYRDSWQGHYSHVAFLVSKGYAVLNANPRGSTGRGRAFAESVKNDYGGKEASDILSGVDALVERGVADPKRLGITGGSHGGYLTAWIVTQTDRFAAAVPCSAVTDCLEHYTTSNIPAYLRLFMEGSPYAGAEGQFFNRSPLRFVEKCKTPVLQIVGSEDRCVAPAQARQFHRALLDQGVTSVIVEYPLEGHGIRKFPAHIDMCHRKLAWFHKYMPV